MARNDDPYARASDWLSTAARGKPEALLLVAAGAALLLRGSSKSGAPKASPGKRKTSSEYYSEASGVGRAKASAGGFAGDLSTKAASASAAVGDYVSDASGRISAMAQDYSEDMTKRVQTIGDMFEERPLLLAVAGLAAGAAMAAIAPMTQAESRAFRDVRARVGEAASELTGNMKDAVFEATQNVRKEVQENGLSADGIKDVLRDAADDFVASATGSARQAKADKESKSS